MSSAVAARRLRRSSRTSLRVERPAVMDGISGCGGRMLAQADERTFEFLKLILDKRLRLSRMVAVTRPSSWSGNDQGSFNRNRSTFRARSPASGDEVRPPQADALHRQAPERAGDAQPGRQEPAAACAR